MRCHVSIRAVDDSTRYLVCRPVLMISIGLRHRLKHHLGIVHERILVLGNVHHICRLGSIDTGNLRALESLFVFEVRLPVRPIAVGIAHAFLHDRRLGIPRVDNSHVLGVLSHWPVPIAIVLDAIGEVRRVVVDGEPRVGVVAHQFALAVWVEIQVGIGEHRDIPLRSPVVRIIHSLRNLRPEFGTLQMTVGNIKFTVIVQMHIVGVRQHRISAVLLASIVLDTEISLSIEQWNVFGMIPADAVSTGGIELLDEVYGFSNVFIALSVRCSIHIDYILHSLVDGMCGKALSGRILEIESVVFVVCRHRHTGSFSTALEELVSLNADDDRESLLMSLADQCVEFCPSAERCILRGIRTVDHPKSQRSIDTIPVGDGRCKLVGEMKLPVKVLR